ncbi:MAG TPA: hypothetical protein VFJ84_02075 [Candidatus Saccharimonadales bacterium]|nr:hypothetical protein [Candidatus Saccharimonadales bacterium]
MSDIEHGPIFNEVKGAHFIPGEGVVLDSTIHYPAEMHRDEVREIVADSYDIPEDNILFEGEEPRNDTMRRAKRLSVGFRRWNSSWDPKAPKVDPSLN